MSDGFPNRRSGRCNIAITSHGYLTQVHQPSLAPCDSSVSGQFFASRSRQRDLPESQLDGDVALRAADSAEFTRLRTLFFGCQLFAGGLHLLRRTISA